MLLLLAVLAVSPAAAQQRPDFSGTWSLAPDAPPGPNGKPAPAPGHGLQITITQTPDTFTVSRVFGGVTVPVTHPLDGSETRTRTPGGLCLADAQNIWTASWQDNAVVTTLTGSVAPGSMTAVKRDVKATFRMPAPDTLAVEMLLPAANASPRTVTTVYKRTGAAPAAAMTAPEAPVTPARIAALEWLAGTWVGGTAPTVSEERWTSPAGGSMLAIARSLRNSNMSSFEFLCIVERKGGLVYTAMPNGRQPATDFTMTKIDGTDVTFENPAHDFPKMIRYTLKPDGTLAAVVSGSAGQKPLVFTFKRQS